MKWDIQTVGFNADSSLTDYTKEKVSGLQKYMDGIVGAEVYLKLDNSDTANKLAEIKLNIPGNDIYADSQAERFEGAINDACDKLKRQIRKLKTKMSTY